MKLKCPICNEELHLNHRQAICTNRHCFDVSKEGYVNLLRKQKHKEYGDSVEMIRARHAFFQKDPYLFLKEKLVEILRCYHPQALVDCGCGEGYYTNYIHSCLPDIDIAGFDISKEAVRIASKNSNVRYFVAGVHQIPLFDDSVDMILNCFAPHDFTEYRRILKDDGTVVAVTCGRDHLLSLKQVMYDDVYLNEPTTIVSSKFSLKEQIHLSSEWDLKSNQEIKDLFAMTPYRYRTSKESIARLETLDTLRTKLAFDICIYKVDCLK